MPRYSPLVLEHFQDPRNAGAMHDADAVGTASLNGSAPYVYLYFRIRNGVIEKATFQAFGCGFVIACCSALTEQIANQTVATCESITPEILAEHLGGMPPDKQFCPAIAVAAMRDALQKYVSRNRGTQ